MNKWDKRFFNMCELVASWSKDPSTKVGAVIVDNFNRVLSIGYNGFPRGVEDLSVRYLDCKTKYQMVIHAEENAILNATSSLENTTVYIYPLCPCSNCAARIIQAGIKTVKVLYKENNPDRDYGPFKEMLNEAGVHLEIFNNNG